MHTLFCAFGVNNNESQNRKPLGGNPRHGKKWYMFESRREELFVNCREHWSTGESRLQPPKALIFVIWDYFSVSFLREGGGVKQHVLKDLGGMTRAPSRIQIGTFLGSRPGPTDRWFVTTLTHLAPVGPPWAAPKGGTLLGQPVPYFWILSSMSRRPRWDSQK